MNDQDDRLLEESEPVDEVQEEARGNRYRYFDEKGEHLHTLDTRPLLGTSTVNKEIGAGIIWWAAGEALKPLGWRNARTETMEAVVTAATLGLETVRRMTPDEYGVFLQSSYRAHDTKKNKAAKDGTSLHASLEKFVKHCITEHDGLPFITEDTGKVRQFSEWARENIRRFIWSEAHCYSESMWVGGITDCGAEMLDGKIAIIDFKSAKQAYFEHFRQAGGYAQQIEENGLYTADGTRTHPPMKIDALVIFPFGGGEPKTIYAVEDYQRAFVGKLNNYKLQQSFDEMAVI